MASFLSVKTQALKPLMVLDTDTPRTRKRKAEALAVLQNQSNRSQKHRLIDSSANENHPPREEETSSAAGGKSVTPELDEAGDPRATVDDVVTVKLTKELHHLDDPLSTRKFMMSSIVSKNWLPSYKAVEAFRRLSLHHKELLSDDL